MALCLKRKRHFSHEKTPVNLSVYVLHTAFSDSVAGLLVAGFVLQVLGCCDLSLQEGASLVQLLQTLLKIHQYL